MKRKRMVIVDTGKPSPNRWRASFVEAVEAGMTEQEGEEAPGFDIPKLEWSGFDSGEMDDNPEGGQ